MNQELYHEIEKYIHHIEWYSDFDIYLMHLNLNIDLYQIYPEEANIMLYKYYKFGYIIRDKNDKDIILCCGLIYYHYY